MRPRHEGAHRRRRSNRRGIRIHLGWRAQRAIEISLGILEEGVKEGGEVVRKGKRSGEGY